MVIDEPVVIKKPFDEFAYEGVEDDDFMETPYVPPDIIKVRGCSTAKCTAMLPHFADHNCQTCMQAHRYRDNQLWKAGIAPVCGTSVDAMSDMGVGITLYFKFLVQTRQGAQPRALNWQPPTHHPAPPPSRNP